MIVNDFGGDIGVLHKVLSGLNDCVKRDNSPQKFTMTDS